jgi:predicted CXXCH cytochrome family protein
MRRAVTLIQRLNPCPLLRETLPSFIRTVLGLLPLLGAGGLLLQTLGMFPAFPSPGHKLAAQDAPVSPAAAIMVRDKGCAACHHMDKVLSHPVNITPSMTVPSLFPLEEGQITCTTCHSDDAAAHAQARERHDGMLRTSSAATLCSECHAGATGQAMHSALGRAHLQFPSRDTAPTDAEIGGLDKESSTCLSCHDGTVAKAVGIGLGDQPGDVGDHGRSHPIGALYKDHRRPAMGQTPFPMVPASALNPRLRLFDQRLGCGSCHSPYSHEDKQLVMNNTRSRLCLSCHQEY